VPASRLTRRYFRRWWFGKGVSRSALEGVQPITELGVDLRATPHFLGVPRFMYGSAVRDLAGMLRARLRGRPAAAFRHEMMVAYFAGYWWSRWRRRRASLSPAQRLQVRHSELAPPCERSGPAATAQRTSKAVTTGR
jgi:hypothetical protein